MPDLYEGWESQLGESETMMNDDQKLRFAQRILDQHFGIRDMDGRAVCATCGLGVEFPCDAAILARDVKDGVLAR